MRTTQPTRGYLTQCDKGGDSYGACDATVRLEKPRRWRCAGCEKKYDPLQEQKT